VPDIEDSGETVWSVLQIRTPSMAVVKAPFVSCHIGQPIRCSAGCGSPPRTGPWSSRPPGRISSTAGGGGGRGEVHPMSLVAHHNSEDVPSG
jgi:hypothetical protein